MLKFSNYLNENKENSIQLGFIDLKSKIHSMFNTFKRAAVNTWSKANLNDKLKTDIVNNLKKIINQLQTKTESYNLGNVLNEFDNIVNDLSPEGMNDKTGRKIFDISDVLKNMEDKIMTYVHNLEKSLLMQKIGSVGTDVKNVMKKLDSPPKPIQFNQENTAYDAIKMLSTLKLYDKAAEIIHPYSGEKLPIYSLNSNSGLKNIISAAHKDSNFTLKYGNKELNFNIGDIQDVENAVKTFYSDKNVDPNEMKNKWASKPFGAVHGAKLKPIKVHK